MSPGLSAVEGLVAAGLETGYGELQVLWGVSIEVPGRGLTAVVGANGSGKTTLLRCVMGLLPAWRGTIHYLGAEITRQRPHRRARLGLVLVPEGRQLFTDLTVMENLELGATPRRARARSRENLVRVFELFPRLADRRRQVAGTLSGGEQQMLAIARGLMGGPRLLLLDEPSLGLAPRLVLEVFEVVLRLKAGGLPLLLVEQNVELALAVADHAYVLAGGRVTAAGPARQVRELEVVRRSYLGR